MSFQLTLFELGLITRLLVETPLRILGDLVKATYYKTSDFEGYVKKSLENVLKSIQVVTQTVNIEEEMIQNTKERMNRREETIQNIEGEKEKIADMIINDCFKIIRDDVLNELPIDLIILPIRFSDCLFLIIDRYLKLLTGTHDTELIKVLDNVIFNISSYLMSQIYLIIDRHENGFSEVAHYIADNINNIKYLYNIKPKLLFDLLDLSKQKGNIRKCMDMNGNEYYVFDVKSFGDDARPIIDVLNNKHPIKYYTDVFECDFHKELYLSERKCSRGDLLKHRENVFLIPYSLLEVDIGRILEALVYLRLRSNIRANKLLITHNVLLNNIEYDILSFQLTYTGSYRDVLDIEIDAINVFECKKTVEEKDMREFDQDMKMLEKHVYGVKINPYIICIESEVAEKDNIILLEDWEKLDRL
ncbi:MAG: hypothetical protein QXY40_05020 [Candidatus Methanomethylicia archaeon]